MARKIKNLLKEKVIVPDFTDFPLHKKIQAFGQFSTEQLVYVAKALNLKSGIDDLVALHAWFSSIGKAPTAFELKLVDAYINSEAGYSRRCIAEIEIASDNPYVRKSLEMYNDYRKQNGIYSTVPRTFADYADIGSRLAFDNGNDNVVNTRTGTVVEYNCYRNGRRANYYLRFTNSINEFDAGEFKKNLGRIYAYGYKPIALVYDEYDGVTPQKRMISARISDLLDVSAFEATEKCVSCFCEPVAKSNLLCYSESAEHSQEIITGREEIILVNINRAIVKTGSQPDWSILHREGITLIKATDDGVINGLIDIGYGFEINIAHVPLDDLSEDRVLIEPNDKFVIALCKKSNIIKVIDGLTEAGCKCYVIGKLKKDRLIRMSNEGAELVRLNLDYVRNRLYDPLLCKINDSTVTEPTEVIEDPIDKIKSGIELGFYKSDYALNPLNGANALYPRLVGKKQLTPMQSVTVIPEYNRYDNIVNLISSGIAFTECDAFTGAAKSVLTAILKLVVAGAPLTEIAISSDYFYDRKRLNTSSGQMLGALLGCAYVQRELTIGCAGTRFFATEMSADTVVPSYAAVGMAPKDKVVTPSFEVGDKLYRIMIPVDEFGMPDLKFILKLCGVINININIGNITAGCVIEHNESDSIARGIMGNANGFTFAKGFAGGIDSGKGDILLAIKQTDDFASFDCEYIGVVNESGIILCDDNSIEITELERVATRFPFADNDSLAPLDYNGEIRDDTHIRMYKTRPNLLIVYNDYASEKAIHTEASILGFDVTSLHVGANTIFTKASSRKVRELIERTDLLILAGRSEYNAVEYGIGALLKIPSVLDALNESLFRKGSLVVGTGEGAKVLFDLGYLTDGNAEHGQTEAIVLTESKMGELTARIPSVRVERNNSVLLQYADFDTVYSVGCGGARMRLDISDEMFCRLVHNGQICARFVNKNGFATESYPCNPEGSSFGVSSISSPNGRVLGVFALPEKACTIINQKSLMRDILYSALKHFEPIDD